MKVFDNEIVSDTKTQITKSITTNNDIDYKVKELEGILQGRFNADLTNRDVCYLKDLLRLFPNCFMELREHCLYLNKPENLENVYNYFIQRLRVKTRRKRERKPRLQEIEQPKQKAIYHFKPSELMTDAKRFQYKENSDSFGVTDRLIGVNEWNAQNSGIVIVWESAEGKRFIADGHQRLGLANRLNDKSIRLDGLLYREVDGYSPSKVRMLAAQKNIAEQTGTPIDTAKIIRELGGAKNYPPDLPKNGVMYQYGIALSRLGDEAFQKVVNGAVTIEQGAVIGNIIREDYTKQSLAIDVVAREEIETLIETELMARQVLNTSTTTVKQYTLFGVEEFITSNAVHKVKIINNTLKELRKTKNIMSHLDINSKTIEGNGNILHKLNNEELKKRADSSIEIIKRVIFYENKLSIKVNELAKQVGDDEKTINQAVKELCTYCLKDNLLNEVLSSV